MKDISVIIAHFAPDKRTQFYRDLLKRTIASVRNQEVDFETEILVCDDGSYWSRSLAANTDLTVYTAEDIASNKLLSDLDVDFYLALPDVYRYRGVAIKHRAFELARYDKVVVLDDDQPFISRKSLARYSDYLDKYHFVRGRVLSPKGRPQLFFSTNAQGTNYGIRRSLYFQCGGFGKYLFDNGYGEDNDILWRVYSWLKGRSDKAKLACFAGEILTKDLASNRWLDRSNNGLTIEPGSQNSELRYESFVREFFGQYGVSPSNNPSRHKHGWMAIPSLASFVSEIKYSLIYCLHFPSLVVEKIRTKLRKFTF